MSKIIEFFERLWRNKVIRAIVISSGILLCFFAFGIVQEKVMRGCFGNDEQKCDKFKFELTLVGILCCFYAVVARVLLKVTSYEEDKTSQGWYASAAFCYISTMVCENIALRFVTYPTQVIGKCSKPISVMIIGALLANKRHTIQKYFFVSMIVVGVIMFVYDDRKGSKSENSYLGLALIGMSLLSDGVLGAVEDRIRAASRPSAFNFMFSINAFSAVILAFATIVTGEISGFYEFTMKYPDVLLKIIFLAAVGSFGQVFIFLMISHFGPLPCSIVTTVRKFFTVMFSILFMGNEIIERQYFAVFLVFTTLLADALFGNKRCEKEAEAVPTKEQDIEKNIFTDIELNEIDHDMNDGKLSELKSFK